MCETKFYVCEKCGNIVGMVHSSGVPMMCCGQKMAPLVPGTTDASLEKHVPVVAVNDDIVTVDIGSVAHPMTEEHYITWVYLQTDRGGQRKCLCPQSDPQVKFTLKDEKPVAVYAWCNLHGLWKTEI